MKTLSRRFGLPQYPQLEAEIREQATAVAAGLKEEAEARSDILVAVLSCDLIASTVRHWLAGPGAGQSYLFDDLVFAAEEWTIRAITGHAVGEYMIDTGSPSATLMDLERIRSGASAVGYLRKGLMSDMRKFLRTTQRRAGLGRSDYQLVDANLISGATTAHLTPAEAATLREWEGVTAHHGDDMADLRADLARSDYLDSTMGQSESARAVKRSQTLQAFYQVPPATRPLQGGRREAMLATITADLTAAHRALRAHQHGRVAPEGLEGLWSQYNRDEADVVLSNPRSVDVAHTLALAALSPWPVMARAVRARFRKQLGRIFDAAGLDRNDGVDLAAAFLADEYERPEPTVRAWTELATPVVAAHPGLLGEDLHQVRARLVEIAEECRHPVQRRQP